LVFFGVGAFVVLLEVDGLLELVDFGLHVDVLLVAGFTLVFGLHVDAGFTLVFGLHVEVLLAAGLTVAGLQDGLLVVGLVVAGLQAVSSVLEVPVLIGSGTTTFPVGLDKPAR
jgi:hypothetical protein